MISRDHQITHTKSGVTECVMGNDMELGILLPHRKTVDLQCYIVCFLERPSDDIEPPKTEQG